MNYRGVRSNLPFIGITLRDFPRIIDYLFEEYNIDTIDAEIVLSQTGRPRQFKGKIYLAPANFFYPFRDVQSTLKYYMKLNFQFAHELTHAIQDHQGRILAHELDENCKFPPFHACETEAVANHVDVCENLLGYSSNVYSARLREFPDYYDYDSAFKLVDTKKISELRKSFRTK